MRLNESNWGRFERRKTIIIWSKTGRAIQIAATDVTDFFHFKLLSRFDEKIDAITNFLSTFLSLPFHLLDFFILRTILLHQCFELYLLWRHWRSILAT